jgi:hypothetical protein
LICVYFECIYIFKNSLKYKSCTKNVTKIYILHPTKLKNNMSKDERTPKKNYDLLKGEKGFSKINPKK